MSAAPKIPQNLSQYRYIPHASIVGVVDGHIMPVRNAGGLYAKNCLRMIDFTFMREALTYRSMARDVSNPIDYQGDLSQKIETAKWNWVANRIAEESPYFGDSMGCGEPVSVGIYHYDNANPGVAPDFPPIASLQSAVHSAASITPHVPYPLQFGDILRASEIERAFDEIGQLRCCVYNHQFQLKRIRENQYEDEGEGPIYYATKSQSNGSQIESTTSKHASVGVRVTGPWEEGSRAIVVSGVMVHWSDTIVKTDSSTIWNDNTAHVIMPIVTESNITSNGWVYASVDSIMDALNDKHSSIGFPEGFVPVLPQPEGSWSSVEATCSLSIVSQTAIAVRLWHTDLGE